MISLSFPVLVLTHALFIMFSLPWGREMVQPTTFFFFLQTHFMIWSWHRFIAEECFIDVIFNFEQAVWFHLTDEELCICFFGFVLFFFLLQMWEEESRPNYKKLTSNRRLYMHFSSQPAKLPHKITLCIWKARRTVPKKQGSVNWPSIWCCFCDCYNFSFYCSWDRFHFFPWYGAPVWTCSEPMKGSSMCSVLSL